MKNHTSIIARPRGVLSVVRSNSSKKKNLGMTLVEGVIAITILGVFAAIAFVSAGGIRTSSMDTAKGTNAVRLGQLGAAIIQAGGTVGTGATYNVDLTSATTAVTSLNTGVTIGGVTYKMQPAVPTPASYTFSGTPTATSILFGYTAGAGAAP